MKNGLEQGRSMLEMLGVLAIIGILSLTAFWGYQRAIVKSRINKTVETATFVLQKYADFTLKNTTGVNLEGEDAMSEARSLGLSDTCELLPSEVEEGYQICESPLGELYLKFKDMGNGKYNYMLFVMLVGQKPDVCASFLNQGWRQIIPEEWWPDTMIWLKSEVGETTVYPQGGRNVTPSVISNACNNVCSKKKGHCMIVFDLAGVQGGL